MVDVDLESPLESLLAGTGDVGALEQDDGVEVRSADLADADPGQVGKAREGQRRWIVVDDGHDLAEEVPHQREGPGRAERIAVGPEVGGHGYPARRLDPLGYEGSRISGHVSSS